MLKLSPVVSWHEKPVGGNTLAGTISQSCKRFRGNNNYKNKRSEWMLLSAIKALKKDNAKLRVINHKQKNSKLKETEKKVLQLFAMVLSLLS